MNLSMKFHSWKPLLAFVLCMFGASVLSAQLTIIVDEIPANTPEDPQIFIAGDFQGWDPGNPEYLLEEQFDGSFLIEISPTPGTITYKFTRGSWDTVEGNENGGFLPDRQYVWDGEPETTTLQILTWEDTGGLESTAADNVSIMDPGFYMPQLDRYRRVWIYLPPDYELAPDKYYPVLYMHDGQNVFDAATSFVGEWEVDETLNDLFDAGDYGCIVVAVDNGGEFRIDEYSPWVNTEYGGGQGDDYMQFLVNTLKPFIDMNYRSFTGREYTGIMGSSLGGLISTYGGIEYSGTFSKIGTFSPSYWFADESFTHVEETVPEGDMKIYTIAGELEGGSMVADAEAMETTYEAAGYSDDEHLLLVHDDGQHSEWYWRREFGDAYEWLFGGLDLNVASAQKEIIMSVYPNPAREVLHIRTSILDPLHVQISNLQGKVVMDTLMVTNQLDISFLPAGSYIITCAVDELLPARFTFIKQ